MSGTILVAVDGSEAAFHVAQVAVDLAAALGDRVVALSVLHDGDPGGGPGAGGGPAAGGGLIAALGRVAAMARACGVPVETLRVHGRTEDQLLAHAARLRVRFVVVGRGDQHPAGPDPIGRVLDLSTVPVVVVPMPGRVNLAGAHLSGAARV